MSELVIPEKCKGCGVQDEISVGYANANLAKSNTSAIAWSLMEGTGDLLDDIQKNAPDPETAKELTDQFRNDIVRDLDVQDKIIAGLIEESKENADACDGVLPVEVVSNGRCYKLGVCTSKMVLDMGQPNAIPVIVEVREIEG